MRTQVGIVGGGPAGLVLGHLLHLRGVEAVVLEARDREYVQQRVRAGVLEQPTVDLLGDGSRSAAAPRGARARRREPPFRRPHPPHRPERADRRQGDHHLRPAGGGQGPDQRPPGAGLPLHFEVSEWPDQRIWEEMHQRVAAPEEDWSLREGTIFEKGVTPMRSFVVEPMQFGRLYLAGDAAHIVSPMGAKGLNLAVADVCALADALAHWLERATRRGWTPTRRPACAASGACSTSPTG